MNREEFYTAMEAAKVLGISDRRVRKLASEGRIEGERTDEGWMLFRRSVHEFRDLKRARETQVVIPEWPIEAREALERVEKLQRELGRLEGEMKAHRELTEVAESTLREQLERERERADAERERAGKLEEEAKQLREKLEKAQQPWWRRVFSR
jgi:excisionase family DNA binding protein